MNCPTCYLPLVTEALHGQQVDRCANCGGRWLDHAELGAIVRHVAPADDLSDAEPCTTEELACPHCESRLEPFEYAHDSGVTIHKCRACEGVWLTAGQLTQLVRYRQGTPAEQRLSQAIGDQMQTTARWQFARGLLRSRVLSGLVVALWLCSRLSRFDVPWNYRYQGLYAILLLGFIWFPDAFSNMRYARWGQVRPRVSSTAPSDMVAIAGWLLLLSLLFRAWMFPSTVPWWRVH
ncbi:TFIIB-type zinc ribbon-containing protein [Aeoliella mucimassa]|uniref:Transcription factor zinc-finger domain-containing protein n=1 Tax=Aeoliella mucimassa TaxID=2527972 RepID=A0A518AV48_9BACT|nr:zf-TFIIB domain-containing protein [Aeoliella mucimassa]QDU58588.1 hypothetical protein Pan181_48270 [Aeoliella mucimassa]